MLRAERSGQVHASRRKRVQAVGQVGSDAGGMGEQGNALALQRRSQRRVSDQPVDSE
jgi:hypothetical protein